MVDRKQNPIALKVKWLFHYLGFIIERVPDENKLFFELNNCHESVQRYVLKRITDNIRIANNHKLYNKVLKRYIPTWDNHLTSAVFIGNGVGEYSFNTFRKVYFENRRYFEKIYFNNTHDLAKIEWFSNYIYPLLKNSINVARLHRVVKGDVITIVYFEFAELSPLPATRLTPVSFEFSRELIRLSNEDSLKKLAATAPAYFKDYKLHAYYRGNISLATKLMKELSYNALSPESIENIIKLQPLVVTHGDIQRTNLFSNNYLIDWDSFGFYPLGLEAAYIICKFDVHSSGGGVVSTSNDLQTVLLENYSGVICSDQWKCFELCVFYFFFIFIALDDGTELNVTLQKDVFNRIEQLYNDVSIKKQEESSKYV